MTPKVPTPPLQGLRRGTRRQEFSATTRQALIDVARRLFATQGYAGTSLDEIVAGADVTKGALYHHFKGKQELFEEAFRAAEVEAADRIRARVADADDPWEKAVVGLREFLAVTRTEEYRRIVIQDGPAVLGYERYREQEERSAYALVHDIVARLLTGYPLEPSTVEAFTRLFFGAMSATGAAVSTSPDPARASADAETAIVLVLAGVRSLIESGTPPPAGEDLAPGVGPS